MQDHSSIELRLKHLNDNRTRLSLTQKSMKMLCVMKMTLVAVKYQREIDKLWESANRYRQELDELNRYLVNK